ncbi:MAG: HAD family phosphatase [Actinobacteria bacterium]|nr:HAD family phosphatase [Actinomycetota bacterium]MCB8996403.1 HAD family phosphatase [Actinomycetota bacterium]HRY09793.1 HAD family phosphatase [Candidatus Nanopelagicales bacterium]
MPLSGLVVDWGGVLTIGMREAMGAWVQDEAIDVDAYIAVMREWLGPEYGMEAAYNPIHAIEKGELEVPEFEVQLADALARRTGQRIDAEGLLGRMFRFFRHSPDMIALVRRAKEQGIRTALLSNSWGNNYPTDLFDGMFDVVVISGEVGMRKPDADIFHYTLDQIGLVAPECVFVDDLLPNVHAARELGFVAIHHTDYPSTAGEIDALFGRTLSR